ncbi:reverse transcriptase domain-containing protein, partial [Actinobacillus pleuropneumoniae]
VIYKVISKVVANRLKPLLPLLISQEQSGYVEGRQILDDILLTHEIIHSLKQSKQAGMILKLDLSKAFDKLSWNFVQQ